ncbi:MAG TPA: UDP-N-acetylmuramoyl-L-alanine--D-glutamate ligase [Opitutaceae bacterium]|nr:UDP-N-acetylmuramoyl-L-alanine--D-glutamate ligase [Opitutaceae bacterium]
MSLKPPPFLAPLLAKPVAILGGGVSGEGVRALAAALGADAKIYDARAARGAEFTAVAAQQHAFVVFSPGFAPEHPWLALARAAGAECMGEMDFASLFWTGRLVAITGTNGKTTLTEFLTHALRGIGHDARATGNIGDPFSRLVVLTGGGAKDSYAICEVSSFQAETFRHFRADATLWTNFAEDHLERHPGLEAYFSAKWKLVEHTDPGAVFIGSSVARHAQKFDRPLATVQALPTENQLSDPHLARTVFAEYPQRENFLLAAAWWHAEGLDPAALHAAARTFKLGRHRLTRVADCEGVTYWNDSKATNFHAVEAALAGFSAPVVLIAGGKAKGGDLAGFVHRIAAHVKHIVLIGETAAELAFQCATFRAAHTTCATLAEAVRRAAELAAPGEHVLLSPGFASFDMFRSYEDRGEQFEQLVRSLPAQTAASLR